MVVIRLNVTISFIVEHLNGSQHYGRTNRTNLRVRGYATLLVNTNTSSVSLRLLSC